MTPDQILKRLFEGIDRTIKILKTESHDPTTGTYIWQVDNYKWTRANKVIQDDSGNDYLVQVVSINSEGKHFIEATKISVSGNDPVMLLAEDPKYWEGYIRMVQPEVEMVRDSSEKTPMMYVGSIGSASFQPKISRIKWESPIVIYFLDQANFDDWTSGEYFEKVTASMYSLMQEFIKSVKKQKHLIDFDNDMTYKQIKKFASVDSSGHLKKYFNDDLSGVELNLDLKLINSTNCKDPYAFK